MEKIIIKCIKCDKKLRIPKEGNLEVTCPTCRHSWELIRENNGINILVIGKTGVGKSTFCNYLFNSNLFESGSGKPVTNWMQNFQHHAANFDGYRLNIYDSVGLETDNMEHWGRQLSTFLDERSFKNSSPRKWVHGVFYALSAASARIEPAEVNIIKKVLERKIPLQIILTKKDQASADELAKLKAYIKDISAALKVHEVCSVSVRKRVGSVEASGKEDILRAFLKSLDEDLKHGILQYSIKELLINAKAMHEKIISLIDNSKLGVGSLLMEALSDSKKDLDEVFEFDLAALDAVEDQYNLAFSEVDAFLNEHGYFGDNSARLYLDKLSDELTDNLDELSSAFEKHLTNIEDKFGGGIMDKLSGVYESGKIFLNMKGFMRDAVNQMLSPVIDKLEQEARKVGVY